MLNYWISTNRGRCAARARRAANENVICGNSASRLRRAACPPHCPLGLQPKIHIYLHFIFQSLFIFCRDNYFNVRKRSVRSQRLYIHYYHKYLLSVAQRVFQIRKTSFNINFQRISRNSFHYLKVIRAWSPLNVNLSHNICVTLNDPLNCLRVHVMKLIVIFS